MLERPQVNLALRGQGARILIGFVFAVFIVRLWYLQILRGDYYREQSENNRLQTIFVQPPRGTITDRNGVVLANTRPSFNIELVPEATSDPKGTVVKLAQFLNIDPTPLLEKLANLPRRRRYEPRVLVKDATREQVAKVLARRPELPGLAVSALPARQYPLGTVASHVLGYVREISRDQLDKAEFRTYRIGDIVGQYGLEGHLEKYLQGKRGIRRIIVNAVGTKIGEASGEMESPGHTVETTLDVNVQRAAEKALGDRSGAVVALDPNTGEVLALVSKPGFDPNAFVGEMSPSLWRELSSGESRPLQNRAVQGAYAPGSVFKIFMQYAGLAEGVIGINDGPRCLGSYKFGSRTYNCHKRDGHGPVDLYSSLVLSCDVYFYVLGQRLGVDRIHEYATLFGFGRKTGLELVDENPGLIPSSRWKLARFGERWYPGETLSVAIGQGATLTTPIQVANAVAAFVNGGKLYRPYLVKKIVSTEGGFIDDDYSPRLIKDLKLDKHAVEAIKRGMVGVVEDPRGTGKKASLKEFGITVGGKTGTAQVVSLAFHKKGTKLDHHAWFVGYAPAEDPKIVVVALVEHGGGGGANAAPVVRETMKAFFGIKKDE
jgi:penicillin-binding protein 2